MATKHEEPNFGVFTKDGLEAVADAPGEAVRLRWEGWQEATPATSKPEPRTALGTARTV